MRFRVKFQSTSQRLNVKFQSTSQSFNVKFRSTSQRLNVKFQDFQCVSKYEEVDPYNGNYSVIPKVEAQTLQTKEKFMINDLEIQKIPFFDVSNTAGGSTVYIGNSLE